MSELARNRIRCAVESGGHSSVVGASNINGTGVTLDLSRLASIELCPGRSTVKVGVGARWLDVYTTLEQYGLTVAGARAGTVGVGGFILGGGLSWFASSHGWACDMVDEFGLILANGTMTSANHTNHPDLFWSLKGAGTIFGVVHSMTLRTIPTSNVIGGTIAYDKGELTPLIEALVQLNHETTAYSTASAYLSFGIISGRPTMGISAYMVDLGGRSPSPLLSSFTRLPRIWNSVRSMNISDSAAEIGPRTQTPLRSLKFTVTVLSETLLLSRLLELFQNLTNDHSLGGSELIGMMFQPLPVAHTANRDNALGLAHQRRPLMMVTVELSWIKRSRDDLFNHLGKDLHFSMVATAESMDKLHPFTYLNYAAAYQDPLQSYGSESIAKLREVQKKYDPGGHMHILRQGIFELK